MPPGLASAWILWESTLCHCPLRSSRKCWESLRASGTNFIAGRAQSSLHSLPKWGTVWAIPHVIAFLRYIRKLIRLRRINPQSDLTSALAQAEQAGDKLNENELLAMIFLLLVAGHETTVNLISNGTLALLRPPDQVEKLPRKPPWKSCCALKDHWRQLPNAKR